MSDGSVFESALSRGLAKAFKDQSVSAVAYRHYEFKLHEQLFDIMIDSPTKGLYAAIECKSIDYEDNRKLYFSAHFKTSANGHQIERETEFLELSGRIGVLAVEIRNAPQKRRTCYFVPWKVVQNAYSSGRRGLSLAMITECPSFQKRLGIYNIDVECLKKALNYAKRGELSGIEEEQQEQ